MTQLLWKSSTKLGVGISKTPNGMYNVVANYDRSLVLNRGDMTYEGYLTINLKFKRLLNI